MYLNSSDLELVNDGNDQTIGMRFTSVAIPQSATITNAYVQFQVDESTSSTTSLTIEGEAADNAVTFGSSSGDISGRNRTPAAVSWSPPSWPNKGDAGPAQQTPDLASVIQQIVGRGGWTSGNALVLIVTGTGKRVAESYNGVPSAAPLLRVDFDTGPVGPPTTDPETSSVTASPSTVPADGTTPATITVTLLDNTSAPLVGHGVSLDQGSGSCIISTASGPSDANGQVTFTVTNTNAESVTYTATDDTDGVTIIQTAQVAFGGLTTDPATSTVTATPGAVPADDATTSTITVTLLNNLSAPLAGHAVSLAQGSGSSSISVPSGTSDANGQVTFTVTNTTVESVNYAATDDTDGVTVTQTTQVTFGGIPTDPGTSTVTASPSAVPADGATSATLTVTLLDNASAPVVGHIASVAQNGSSVIGASSGPSDASGQVTFAVASIIPETVTYTAIDDTDGVAITQVAQVTFDPVWGGGSDMIDVRVGTGDDDAEERADGSMYLNSSDLELVNDRNDQTIGMRFTSVAIPQGRRPATTPSILPETAA